jgi:iron complex transport system substrate-binding protein
LLYSERGNVKRVVNLTLAVVLVVGTVGAVTGIGGPVGAATAQETPECGFPITETDATGESVTVEGPPETVVTLNPSGAQILWEIGAKEKVTGVTKHAMNLEGAEERTNISNAGQTISHEIVVDLAPDLVIVPLSRVATEEDVETLRDAGLTVFAYSTANSIDEVRERTLLTGQLVDECEGAVETVEWMDKQLDIVADAVEDKERPDVLYTFFGFTAGEQTHIHDILEAAGGNNVAADAGIEEYQPVNEEVVLAEDPDWIVLNSNSPEIPEGEGFEQTTAVQEGQTIVLDINHLNRPGPRIVYAVQELAEAFHPEAYAEAVEAAESTPTPTGEQSEDDETPASDTEPTESADDDGAGFGVVVLLGGLLGVSLLGLGRKARHTGDK